jgi:Protein of unknown function (DUF998)
MNTAVHRHNNDPATSEFVGNSSAIPATADASGAPKTARWLTLGAVAGPVLFTLSWLILGFLSPGYTAWGIHFAPYSPIVQPISGLGLGPTGPYMNAAFVLCGVFVLVGVAGIFLSVREIGAVARWSCAVLLTLSALGIVMDGVFTLQTFFLHFIGFGVGCGAAALGFLATGFALRRVPRWRGFGNQLLLAGPLTLALVVLSQVTFDQTAIIAGHGIAGLTERIMVVDVLSWFAALGWLAFRRS